jgi:carbamoyl-phosphate synthase small subunit
MSVEGYLLLADGTRLEGSLLGVPEPVMGELVFNTSVVGYQEIFTDPSYCGQIVVFAQPEIGNYGMQAGAVESELGCAEGLVLRSLSPAVYHHASECSLEEYLAERGKTALVGVDTRALVLRLRRSGNQAAILAPVDMAEAEAKERLARMPAMAGANLVPRVSTQYARTFGEGPLHVAILDFGIKRASCQQLLRRGCRLTQLPWDTSLTQIRSLQPNGILLSNGPGDPAAVPGVAKLVAELLKEFPVMGICLGFQIMALALGGATYKLPFGHRGGNHPVLDRRSKRVMITSQNHGFAVLESSLDDSLVQPTHHSLFDGSLEGLACRHSASFGVQFHPEAAPGPLDCLDLFDEFLENMRGGCHAQTG